jgi:hypothetical protein
LIAASSLNTLSKITFIRQPLPLSGALKSLAGEISNRLPFCIAHVIRASFAMTGQSPLSLQGSSGMLSHVSA